MAEEDTGQRKAVKRQPGTYDHTLEHSQVYSMHGVKAVDNEIDRAWARLFDAGKNAGPAVAPAFQDDGIERQYFQYAIASRDLSELNCNRSVTFQFVPGLSFTESGL